MSLTVTDAANAVAVEGSFETRHATYRKFVEERTSGIDRSPFWAILSKEFNTEFVGGRFRALGRRSKAYSPIVGKDQGASIFSLIAFKFSRLFYVLSKKCEAKADGRVKWEKAYRETVNVATAGSDPFTHKIVGAPTCQLNPDVFRMHFFFNRVYPFAKEMKSPNVLEIGAGGGMLSVLYRTNLNARYFVLDLPEVIVLSSALVATMMPSAKILLPNEIDASRPLSEQAKGYDFVFLWPDQSALIENDSMDIAINTSSFMEMTNAEIAVYFKLIQRVVKKGGLFYCCNRLEKQPGLGDTEMRSFFKYPWDLRNEDLLLESNPLITKAGGHLHIDRIQRIGK